jgi:hypothetical protein
MFVGSTVPFFLKFPMMVLAMKKHQVTSRL